MHHGTVYERIGDFPWSALTVLLLVAAFVRRRKAAPAAVVLASTALLLGCGSSGSAHGAADAGRDTSSPSSDTGVDAPGTVDASIDAGACPLIGAVDFGGASCDSCTATRCCPAASTCYAFADGGVGACALLANCVSDCDEDDGGVDAAGPCDQQCVTEFKSVNAPYQAMQACIAAQCMNDAGTGPCNVD
jgi:hypothetical protein